MSEPTDGQDDLTPIAKAARRIIWKKYEGGPPRVIPMHEWREALRIAQQWLDDLNDERLP